MMSGNSQSHAYDVYHVLQTTHAKARDGGVVFESTLLCAASLLTISAPDQQKCHWDTFRELAKHYLDRVGHCEEALAASRSKIQEFLSTTPYELVLHFRRNDPHLWNLRLHVVRTDGEWLVCDGRYDGVVFLTGVGASAPVAIVGRAGETCSIDDTVRSALVSISQGFHACGGGRTPEVRFILNNARPLDQNSTLTQLALGLHSIPTHASLKLYQNRATAFIDPRVFESVAAKTAVRFYPEFEIDPRKEGVALGASICEAFYLPEQSWSTSHRTSLFLKENLLKSFMPGLKRKFDGTVRIFLSLELEKRVWLEQADAFLELFKIVRKSGFDIHVSLNGMTGTIFDRENGNLMRHFSPITEREKEIFMGWKAALGSHITINHLSGMDILKKIESVMSCDFFVTPGGTAAFIGFLAELPGVFYCHPGLLEHFRSYLAMYPSAMPICGNVAVECDAAKGVFDYDWAGVGSKSYTIPVKAFLHEAIEQLNLLRPDLRLEEA